MTLKIKPPDCTKQFYEFMRNAWNSKYQSASAKNRYIMPNKQNLYEFIFYS